MSRNISTPMLTTLTSNAVVPAFLADITFASQTVHCWSGIGNISYSGNTYVGVGTFGGVSRLTEGSDVQAHGISLTLSAIDPVLYQECLTDIQLGAPMRVSLGFLDANANVTGTAYPWFVGLVDQPSIKIGTQSMTISLACETKLSNLNRANMRRYTAADQQLYYPGDTFFNEVEPLNDVALVWN